MSSLRPTAAKDRLAILDTVRGFALCGILLANLVSFAGFYSLDFEGVRALPVPDRAVLFAIDWLIEGKFYALFSMLLGAGFALQLGRAQEAGRAFWPFWYHRTGVLISIGLVHMYLIWYGDILTLYGVLGLLLPLFAARSLRTLAGCVVVLLLLPLAVHLIVMVTHAQPFWTSLARVAQGLQASLGYAGRSTLGMLTSDSAREVLSANVLGAMQRPMSYLQSGRPLQVLGQFLLGALLARTALTRIQRGESLPLRPWIVCLTVGLACSFLYARMKGASGSAFDASARGFVQGVVYHAGSTLLALGYAGTFSIFWNRQSFRRLVAPLAVLGRMALTNYITQSVVCVLVFYGYGLALMGQVRFAWLPLIAAAILLVQWGICRLWLRALPQGPLEWVWRRLTYPKNTDARLVAASPRSRA